MASVLLSPVGNGQQFFDNNGVPLSGGLLYAYQAGSSTPLTTYTTNNGLIPNTNPIILDSAGRCPQEIWMQVGYSYKLVLQTSAGVTLQTLDNLYPILQTTTGTAPTIPTGLIAIWSGSIGSIPTGWLLCDGTNGTPDLRNSFILGAGSTYVVGQTGGTADSIVVSHTHTVTDPGHTHTYTRAWTGNNSTMWHTDTTANIATGNVIDNNGIVTGAIVSATTGITNQSTGVSGTNANLPPYYALAFIMKS